MNDLASAFANGNYAPHGYCLLWEPELIWTHVIADALIAISYFSIPLALVTLVRKRRDLVFGWAFWCFALFILACGFTHVMGIWTLWQSVYGLEAFVKVITAGASVATAALLWPLLPKAVALPSSERLQYANQELAETIRARDEALAELRAEIEQRQRAEAALLQSQKLEAVGQLTGGIAHDFNNLLQAIAGNLELIARKPDDADKVVRWSAAALDAVARGRSLSNQLLAFSRRQRLEITAVPVRETLHGMRDLIERAIAPLSRLEIGSIDRCAHVESDPLQLELAILNLAFNARDAMPEGGTLRITVVYESGATPPGLEKGDWVAITLSDTGTGMPPEVVERATEPFFTTKEVGAGAGMGLAMVYGVVSQSGGALLIDSAPGEGTRVTMFLRASSLSQLRSRHAPEKERAPVRLSGARVLLVDDDPQVRAVLADMLLGAGAQVEQAGGGKEGLAKLAARRPDLLIVDYAMPDVTGAEVARQVRIKDRALPILLVTGYADSDKVSAIKEEVTLLRKPFEAQDLLESASELLSRR